MICLSIKRDDENLVERKREIERKRGEREKERKNKERERSKGKNRAFSRSSGELSGESGRVDGFF